MSKRLLHLDASILGPHSVSRSLSASVVEKLTAADPSLAVSYRDLAANPVPHFSGTTFAASVSGDNVVDPMVRADVDLGNAVLNEFLAADVVVLGLGFYNFTIPSQLKTWIDRLVIPGKTFQYTERGPKGMAGGKRVILAIARGGFYGPGSPMAAFEHAESYLRQTFGFLGITDVEVVLAEGLKASPEAREAGLQKAQAELAALSV